MTQAIERRPAPILEELREQKVRDQLALVIPRHLGVERFQRLAISAVKGTAKLMQCDRASIMLSVFEAAGLGLEPNTAQGHCYLVPYKGRATLVIGYRGFVELFWRAGISVTAEVVREGDEFDYMLGTERHIHHRPVLSNPNRIIRAYVVATLPDGRQEFIVIDESEIERAIASSATGRKTIDNHDKLDTAWYWRKTAVRRMAPFLPSSPQVARALELDAQADAGKPQSFDRAMLPDVVAEYGPQEQTATEKHTERLKQQYAKKPQPEPESPAGEEAVQEAVENPTEASIEELQALEVGRTVGAVGGRVTKIQTFSNPKAPQRVEIQDTTSHQYIETFDKPDWLEEGIDIVAHDVEIKSYNGRTQYLAKKITKVE